MGASTGRARQLVKQEKITFLSCLWGGFYQYLTEGDLTTLNNLTEMGEGQRRGQSCRTRAAPGVKQLICCSSGIGWWSRACQMWTRPRATAATAGKWQTGRKGIWPSHACAGVNWTPVVGLWKCPERSRHWTWIRGCNTVKWFLKTAHSS